MFARSLFLALALTCTPIGASWSEETPPTQPAQAASPEALAAGRDVIHSLVFDSGLVDMLLEPMMASAMPGVRSSVLESPLYRRASRRHREALLAFVDSMPDLLRRELTAECEVIADRAAVRLAQRMTAEELQGFAAFLRSPDARPLFEHVARDYLADPKGGSPTGGFSDEEMSGLTAFLSTPAGAAFVREQEAINTILDEEFDASSERMRPRLETLVLRGMCEALENQCPAYLRRAGRET